MVTHVTVVWWILG